MAATLAACSTDKTTGGGTAPAPAADGTFLHLLEISQIGTLNDGAWAPSSVPGSPTRLAKAAWLRFEHKLTNTAPNTYSLDYRIFLGDATTPLFSGATIRYRSNNYTSGSELSTGTNSQNLPVADAVIGQFNCGTNGSTALNNLSQVRYSYYAAWCVRSDDWCGPYGAAG